jgi:O-antigen/teichoic acid export membrane protein
MPNGRNSPGLQDTAITFVSQGASLVLGLATQSALAWWLGTAGRGSYAACMVYVTILNVLFVVGFDVAIEVFVASRRLTVSEGITDTFVWGTLSSVLAVAAGAVALLFPFPLFEKASHGQFLLAIVSMPLGFMATILLRFPSALGRFGTAAVVNLGQLVLQLGLTLALVVGLGWGVAGAIAAGAVTNAAVLVTVPVLLRRGDGWRWTPPTLQRLRSTWTFGLRYYIGKISNLANVEIGTVVVSMFVGREEIGLFALASTVCARAEFVPNVLSMVILPRVASAEGGRPELVAQCARVTGATCGALLGFLVLFAHPLVKILFSPAFLPAVPLIRIIATGTLIRCVAKVVVPYMVSRNRPGLASAAVFAGMVVNIGVMLLFLGRFGLPAAAAGVALSHLVSSAILLFGFRSMSGVPLGRFWTFDRDDWNPVVRAARGLGIAGL